MGRSVQPATTPPPSRARLLKAILWRPQGKREFNTHLPGAPRRRRRRSLLGPLVAASPAAALGAALKGLKGRAAPPLAAPGPPRRPPGRGVRAAPALVREPRPRLQLPSPRGNVTGKTWAVPQVQGTWAPGAMTRTPLTPRSRGQLSFLRWECGSASPAAPPVNVACGCHRARGWKTPSSTVSAHYMTLGKLLQLPQCGAPSLPLSRQAWGRW